MNTKSKLIRSLGRFAAATAEAQARWRFYAPKFYSLFE